MIVYLDASALVKRYLEEAGSDEVYRLFEGAEVLGTSLVTRAEVSAAFARAARLDAVSEEQALSARKDFEADWPDFARLRIDELTVAQAGRLAWEHGLTGIDALHLASALLWREALGEPVQMATYDEKLKEGAQASQLTIWPEA
ncbi:MAG: type II toxin-antitoxin system VapC family toxin [Chloroflexi bacterium]|nr:type II toxin-antitoxin system VapC family toxin [Chloroflexota bacterium]MCI0861643.1 type II toxin-antitoxin system VapC family toxin [Chloroflexota bacterium]